MPETTIPTTPTDREVAMLISTTPHGCLPIGTETDFGVIEDVTLTAYEMSDGSYLPFATIHGAYKPASPLVVLR